MHVTEALSRCRVAVTAPVLLPGTTAGRVWCRAGTGVAVRRAAGALSHAADEVIMIRPGKAAPDRPGSGRSSSGARGVGGTGRHGDPAPVLTGPLTRSRPGPDPPALQRWSPGLPRASLQRRAAPARFGYLPAHIF